MFKRSFFYVKYLIIILLFPSVSIAEQALWKKAKGFRLPELVDLAVFDRQLAPWGKRLFFDESLSKNSKVSCASCHQPDKFFTDARALAQGTHRGARNTPTIINSRVRRWLFWDGRADSLASQALFPLENRLEHDFHRLAVVHRVWFAYRKDYLKFFPPLSEELVGVLSRKASLSHVEPPRQSRSAKLSPISERLLERVRAHESYQKAEVLALDWYERYESLSPSLKQEVDQVFTRVGLAIAAFEKTIRSRAAPFDKFLDRWQGQGDGEDFTGEGFSEAALRGMKLFMGPARCSQCHMGPYFTDDEFHHVGFPHRIPDFGRALGIRALKDSQWNCKQTIWVEEASIGNSSACEELDFLDEQSKNWVGAFKTPSLRHIADTAPYGHVGLFETLDEVLRHYNQPTNQSRVGETEGSLKSLGLNDAQLSDLKSFLETLSSPWYYERVD